MKKRTARTRPDGAHRMDLEHGYYSTPPERAQAEICVERSGKEGERGMNEQKDAELTERCVIYMKEKDFWGLRTALRVLLRPLDGQDNFRIVIENDNETPNVPGYRFDYYFPPGAGDGTELTAENNFFMKEKDFRTLCTALQALVHPLNGQDRFRVTVENDDSNPDVPGYRFTYWLPPDQSDDAAPVEQR